MITLRFTNLIPSFTKVHHEESMVDPMIWSEKYRQNILNDPEFIPMI